MKYVRTSFLAKLLACLFIFASFLLYLGWISGGTTRERMVRHNLDASAVFLQNGRSRADALLGDRFGAPGEKLKIDVARRVIWSVGPNGRDDGGLVQFDPSNGLQSAGDILKSY